MDNQKEIKLSSNWTNVGLYGGSILLLVMIPIFISEIKEQELHIGIIIGGIIFIALCGFLIYQFIYVCDARIIGNKIVLKKKFRPSKSYSFDRIGYPGSFQLKKTKYITVEMKNDDDTFEKYLIINSKSLLSFEKKDAEQILISLRSIARNKK